MDSASFTLAATDRVGQFVHRWAPDGAPPRAVVQIAHGLAEHGGRYRRLAAALTGSGYEVYANDHRGHGRSVRSPRDLGWFADRGGWDTCIDDLRRLRERIGRDHPGVPVVLLGHSMGSFMAQHFIALHGDALAGVVLSGSGGRPPASIRAAALLARIERLRLGRRGHSALLQALTFGAFNKRFAPARTPFDWLSRDPAEVDTYIADPLCGFPVSVQLTIDVLGGIAEATGPRRQAGIPAALPVHVIAGTRDPVSDGTRTLALLLAAYRAAGLRHVTHRFYPEARHELFNETNRDEVTVDVIAWLDGLTGR
jgi:alpha-beta hydrolase superfamily lysophospholipase